MDDLTASKYVTSSKYISAREDAAALERAARVLKARSGKPNGIWCRVVCHLLRDVAQDIRDETNQAIANLLIERTKQHAQPSD